jgi:hypothetical protein
MVNPAKKENKIDMPPPPRPSANSIAASDPHDPAISPDMSDDDSGPLSANSWHGHDAQSPAGSDKSGNDDDEKTTTLPGGDATSLPVQKRRRVTRACDECRRKKIKCDGKQPCTHCSVYSYGE